jgi:hypothetical protein
MIRIGDAKSFRCYRNDAFGPHLVDSVRFTPWLKPLKLNSLLQWVKNAVAVYQICSIIMS